MLSIVGIPVIPQITGQKRNTTYEFLWKPCCFYEDCTDCSISFVLVELPVKIVKPLRDKIALWKHRGVLECQVSRANAKVRWFKKDVEIRPGEKYEIVSEGVYRKLIINDADYKDEDTYTCDAFDDRTSANFFVEGRKPCSFFFFTPRMHWEESGLTDLLFALETQYCLKTGFYFMLFILKSVGVEYFYTQEHLKN